MLYCTILGPDVKHAFPVLVVDETVGQLKEEIWKKNPELQGLGFRALAIWKVGKPAYR